MAQQIALNVDCMEYMRTLPDKAFDLAIVDPPYFTGPERRGYYGCKVSHIGVHRDYPISPKWDVPGIDYFSELVRVAKKYIVWGWLPQTATTACAFSGTCGTVCSKGKA